MSRGGAASGIDIGNEKSIPPCSTCREGKMTSLPFKKSTRESRLLEIIHADVCGPMRVESRKRKRYFATFTDDHSKWCEVYFLRTKDEVFDAFKKFKAFAEKHTGKKICFLQSDNGGEFTGNQFNEFLDQQGIKRRLTAPHTPQQNGVAERKNRTLVEMAKCMRIQSGLPESFWAEAVSTANFIRNHCITKSLQNKTPYELWNGRIPNLKNFRTFGEDCHYLDKTPGRGKMDAVGVKGNFLGYDSQTKGYRLWVPSLQKVVVSRDVRFLAEDNKKGRSHKRPPNVDKKALKEHNDSYVDHYFYIDPEAAESSKDDDETSEPGSSDNSDHDDGDNPEDESEGSSGAEDDSQEDENLKDEGASDRPSRGRGRPKTVRTGLRGRPRKQYQVKKVSNTEGKCTPNAPTPESAYSAEISVSDALSSPESSEWNEAISSEVESLIKNDTWEITTLPKGEHSIGCRMVLRNKYHADGSVERRKARIVAQGFSQRPGIDFTETYAPVAKLSSVRILLSLAASQGFQVRQLDIATAYLNGDMDERVFMRPPPLLKEHLTRIVQQRGEKGDIGIKAARMIEDIDRHKGTFVCKLNKAIYGLKQAGRLWHRRFDDTLRGMGLEPISADPCVYVRTTRYPIEHSIVRLLIFVDDVLLVYKHNYDLVHILRNLKRDFEVKDLGEGSYLLGIEIKRDRRGITILQGSYVREILKRCRRGPKSH